MYTAVFLKYVWPFYNIIHERVKFCRPSNNSCVKSIRNRSFSGLYFPTFGLNTERYSVSLHIQSECAAKYGPEKLQIRTLFTQWMAFSNNQKKFFKSKIMYLDKLITPKARIIKTKAGQMNQLWKRENSQNGVNLFKTVGLFILKPNNRFTLQIDWLVSIWVEYWS